MRPSVFFNDLGVAEYNTAWKLQESLLAEAVAVKLASRKASGQNIAPKNHLLFCEHPSVFTLGKNGSEKNLLISTDKLKEKNIDLIRTNRGGDITYHGPGQIVGYPIFDLDQFGLSLKGFVERLEEVIIQTLYDYGIKAGRYAGGTGVWLDPTGKNARKICAIGIRASRFITMHGFALNVNTDLKYFSYINPCGFTDKSVTSMQKESGIEWDLPAVKNKLLEKFSEVFQMNFLSG